MRMGAWVLPALLALGVGGGTEGEAPAAPREEQHMTEAAGVQRQQWRHPVTGEEVTLWREGPVTSESRGGKVTQHRNPPFDREAAQREAEAQRGDDWDPMTLILFRKNLLDGATSEQERAQRLDAVGLPPELWAEVDAFAREIGFPLDAASEEELMRAGGFAGSFSLKTPEEGSLLWNPTPEMRARFRELMGGPIQVQPPGDDAPFYEREQALHKEGFARLSPRTPDGPLWLPPVLEPHRARLERWERPVLRPVVVPGTPEPWQSKLGGVPYRPRGAAWPTQTSGSPLYFLAQINLGEANAGGHLPELPRRGLLQFFVAISDASYEDMQRRPELGRPAVRVLYWPDVQRNEAALTREVPEFSDELMHEEFNPPERALAFLKDREIPSLLDDRLAWVQEAIPWEGIDAANVHPNGHRLGGYPMLINAHFPAEEDWRLLFQFDGDDPGEQIYGGFGLGGWIGFFMRPEDLNRLDFSRVLVELDAF